jgi:16S rRNA (guanine966-N2)-methyltransferase
MPASVKDMKRKMQGSGVRITGGSLKGRSIHVDDGLEARYTPSKVRQAIFDMTGDICGSRILDLFAGVGSFTMEALSRGAASAVCVENSPVRSALIRENLDALSLNKYCQVLDMDVRYAIPLLSSGGAVYDIIFMDPPYCKGYPAETMSLLEKEVLYTDETLIVVEHSKREAMSLGTTSRFTQIKTKQYGDTMITLLAVA